MLAIPPQQKPIVHPLRRAGVVELRCDVHKWMHGWVVVHDNPYFAISDDNGNFEISGLPAGHYTIKAWHEDMGTKGVEVDVESGKTAEIEISFS